MTRSEPDPRMRAFITRMAARELTSRPAAHHEQPPTTTPTHPTTAIHGDTP